MNLPKPLTLKTRLLSLIVLVLVLMAGTGMFTLTQLHGVARQVESVYQDRLLPMQQLRLVSHGFVVRLQTAAQLIADGQLAGPSAARELDAIEQQIRTNWTAYLATRLVEAEQRLIVRAEPQLERDLQLLDQWRDHARRGATPPLTVAQLRHELRGLTGLLEALIEVQLEIGRRESAAGQRRFAEAVWLVGGLVLATLVLASLLGASVWRRHRSEQGDVEAKRQRVQQFYLALSQTNQLIVRAPASDQQLYEGLCRICVETGHATLAGVITFDGERFERVAVHGPAERLMPGVPQSWRADAPFARASMGTAAIDAGRHVIANDVAHDARFVQAGAIPPGVEAMAAFPLRRGGRVVGALSLLAPERGFFDEEMVRLLDEMAGDVSFALDNLDREQARRAALARAEAGFALFRQLFNAAATGCIVTRIDDMSVVEINEVMCRRYGHAREQLIGQRLRDLGVGLGDADRARFYEQMRASGHVEAMECTVRTPDGRLRHALLYGDRVDYEGIPCVMSTSIDITELRAAQQEAQARAGAEAANRAKTEFIAQMSHELRTPLHALLGFTQLLEADATALPPPQREWLGHMKRAGWHLLGLINDTLDIARIETGQLPLQLEPVALAPLLADALAMNAGPARQQDLTLTTPSEFLPARLADLAARADRRRLQQVLLNLISNAIKYNRSGGRVDVSVDADATAVRIVVADTGLGMDAAQLARLFEPFNRLGRERGAVEGVGIGLALSRELMRLMGGTIAVDSRAGAGTRFTLELPRATPAPRAADAPPVEAASTGGTVLYVEDNAVNRLIVEQMLARWPALRFEVADDGASGLERAAALRPDLVLVDMQLPDMTGLALIARLKSAPATAAIPVVALSASAMADEVAAARAAGAVDYWTKPLELERFLAKMRSLLPASPP